MRITESQLRHVIRQTLFEDMKGFKDATKDIEFGARIAGNDVPMQKNVKRIWSQQADHQFMKSLVKVHWFGNRTVSSYVKRVEWFVSSGGKDEISCAAYLPWQHIQGNWGEFGVMLQGHVTLAANNMDVLQTGYITDISDEQMQKWKSSGVPKRPRLFVPQSVSDNYILNAKDFKAKQRVGSFGNEVILDNWHVTGHCLQPGRQSISLSQQPMDG